MTMCLICLKNDDDSIRPVENNPHLVTCKLCANKIKNIN